MNDDVFSKTFDCEFCDKELKKQRGCKRNSRVKFVEQFECSCNKNEKCTICGGKGLIKLTSCPRKIFDNFGISRTLSFFNFYQNCEYRQFPNGKSLLKQPIKMLSAFNFLTGLENRKIKREYEKKK